MQARRWWAAVAAGTVLAASGCAGGEDAEEVGKAVLAGGGCDKLTDELLRDRHGAAGAEGRRECEASGKERGDVEVEDVEEEGDVAKVSAKVEGGPYDGEYTVDLRKVDGEWRATEINGALGDVVI